VSARDAILTAIRAAQVPASPPASAVARPIAEDDLLPQFLRVLSEVGGAGIVRGAHQTVASILADALPPDAEGVVIARGRFGVAENAAVYVDAADIDARADIIRAEHLVLLLPVTALVPTMHEAVRRMPDKSACGWFLSGPSKTADIEQALVIGAQGARTLHVILEPA